MIDDTTSMVRDAVARLLKDRVTAHRTMELEAQGLDAALWDQFGALGLRGHDTGMSLEARMAVLQEVGRAGALVPFAESEVLGRWLADAAGLEHGDATLAVVPVRAHAEALGGGGAQLHLPGTTVAWGRHAARVLVLCDVAGEPRIADLEGAALPWQAQANMAGEPCDALQEATLRVPASRLHDLRSPVDEELLTRTGALCRAAAMVGAMGTALDLAAQYAQDRQQFGKSLSQFQVIQSYLAEMAGEVCAASVALALGVAGATRGDGWGDVAVAKVRAGQAANVVTKLAHQIHGAIGMTREYPLHVWTRRLWAWREEFGNETHWSRVLGRSIVQEGEAAFWPRVSGAALGMGSAA